MEKDQILGMDIPLQLILMIIKEYEHPTEIWNPVLPHNTHPVDTSKIQKILASKVSTVHINIGRPFLQILLRVSRREWYNPCLWHCLSKDPCRMPLECTTLNHQIWLEPTGHEPESKAMVKAHPKLVVLDWTGLIYRHKLFQAFEQILCCPLYCFAMFRSAFWQEEELRNNRVADKFYLIKPNTKLSDNRFPRKKNCNLEPTLII